LAKYLEVVYYEPCKTALKNRGSRGMSSKSRGVPGLGRRVAETRLHRGWSQAEVARRMGKQNSQTISEWERDVSAPSAGELMKLAEALEVTTDWLLYGRSATEAMIDATDALAGGLSPRQALAAATGANPDQITAADVAAGDQFLLASQGWLQTAWATMTPEEKRALMEHLVQLQARRDSRGER
jgi:transcriptional regulator with XRE-family HTH domain